VFERVLDHADVDQTADLLIKKKGISKFISNFTNR
jgi:hypothetical protein